ncbi:MAG TPA: hypothetical protein VND91_03740 [Candidatus Saccharimonadia bacterium]|nr:hypothetical protein [Candidatus Saccharimonadia bacterium]
MVRVLVVVCALAIAMFPAPRAALQPPGVVVARTPRQVATSAAPIRLQSFTLTPRARFEAEARVLSRRDYSYDAESGVAPTDLALGWGRMSDARVLDAIEVRQSARWYHFSYRRAPIPHDEIVRSSANMHFIPATPELAARLDSVRPGDVVVFRGKLVDARRRDGWNWRTSLRRDDTGAGSCEIVYLESLELR